jgi:undecaprenyl-phosphate galactose phosphotransferase
MKKRVFDIIFSFIALLILSPIMLIIAIAIKISSRDSKIFYSHQRVGINGKKINVLKFRTMYPDAEQKLQEILRENPELKTEWEKKFKLKNDPRVTPIGKFLRKTSLDELPQFFNVLKGDMSIVGPRPVTEEELTKYYKDKTKYYISVKPGITGYWQVEGRSDVENYKERVDMDVWYIKNQSLLLDLKIILKTIWVIIKGKGAY